MSETFADYQRALMPAGMAGPFGLAWAEAQGAAKDALAEEARDAVKARFVDLAPVDALGRLGADRDLERSPIEDDEDYRARLAQAFELWGWAGTHYGYASALSLVSTQLRGVRFVPQYKWPGSRAPDGRDQLWSRFWVYVWTGDLTWGRFTWGPWATWGAAASPFTVRLWGAWTWGDGIWGSSATTSQLREIRRALAKWKNARDRVPALVVATGAVWGLPGTVWGAWIWGGTNAHITMNLIWGAWTWGATPETAPDHPWHPRWGRSNFV